MKDNPPSLAEQLEFLPLSPAQRRANAIVRGLRVDAGRDLYNRLPRRERKRKRKQITESIFD